MSVDYCRWSYNTVNYKKMFDWTDTRLQHVEMVKFIYKTLHTNTSNIRHIDYSDLIPPMPTP